MSDTDGMAGATGASESASPGAETAIRSIKDQAFDAIAHSGSEDASDYIEERKDRDAEEAGDPSVQAPHRKQRRAERLQRALEAASTADVPGEQQRARSADTPQEGSEGREDAPDFEEVIRRREDVARTTAQYEMRASAFEQVQPDYRETIQSIFSIFPPKEHIADALLRSPVGPQLTYLFANNIDAIEEFNAMSPVQAVRELAKAEGVLLERQRLERQPQPPPRKTTRAAPPMSRLSGGASRGNDDASSMSMDEYVSKRKAGWNG